MQFFVFQRLQQLKSQDSAGSATSIRTRVILENEQKYTDSHCVQSRSHQVRSFASIARWRL